ncbi:MAG: hypothetical protein OEM42_03730 [Deltaproteobacteria bacterium]|nr:hypothetical protein [Deltaproteobacteria bacterium]
MVFLTGHRTLLSVQLYQSLCIALSVVFTCFLAREIYPRGKASLVAGTWLAIHPSLWTYAVFVRQGTCRVGGRDLGADHTRQGGHDFRSWSSRPFLGSSEGTGREGAPTEVLVAVAPFYGFLVWQLAHLIRGDLPSAVSFFVLFFLCYWGEYTLLWGENRFSVPVYPLLVLFAPWEKLGAGT